MRLHSVLLCGRISLLCLGPTWPEVQPRCRSPPPSASVTRQFPTPKRRYTMKEINLRDFYPWYMEDVMVEVTEEVAEELLAGQEVH